MAFGTSKKETQSVYTESTAAQPAASRSYLGKTLQITGEITSNEYLTVEGKVKGNINVSKTLTIGKSGHVDGEIIAEVVKIDGKAEGNIKASDKLEITSNGFFHGNVKSEKLVIEEGAVFQGNANLDEK
ncbi:MAG: polymer-forming cytoskeletal protein [bacterium]|nr:polymer-forming cytoskeletal protein [bacterium]